MRIVVVGIGYVGLANAVLLSQKHEVSLYDIDENKVRLVNDNISPIKDDLIEQFFLQNKGILNASLDFDEACAKNVDYIIIATTTDYDESLGYFNTKSIVQVLDMVKERNLRTKIIIKSTVPIGFTDKMREEFGLEDLIFCPEFLREGKALYDNLNPSRIIVGDSEDRAKDVANLFFECAHKKDMPVLFMSSCEAECVKLFSNTYLAMRVSFFNELHSCALSHHLNAKNIIKGVCTDSRIGDFYNNPSFGYGGYCLPKDTKQLLSNFKDIPNNLISAIVSSNVTRKNFICDCIKHKNPKKVGIYRIVMKKDSDNFRNSIMLDIIKNLHNAGLSLCIYEPLLKKADFEGVLVEDNFSNFINSCDLIVANRLDEELCEYSHKVFSADVFLSDI